MQHLFHVKYSSAQLDIQSTTENNLYFSTKCEKYLLCLTAFVIAASWASYNNSKQTYVKKVKVKLGYIIVCSKA